MIIGLIGFGRPDSLADRQDVGMIRPKISLHLLQFGPIDEELLVELALRFDIVLAESEAREQQFAAE